MSNRSWTDENLKEAVSEAFCWSDVCRALGLKPLGGTFRTVKKHCKRLGFSCQHFDYVKVQARRKGSKQRRLPLREILVQNSTYINGTTLKRRLLKENLLKNECYNCSIQKWLGEPLVLQLDHINGVHDDNRIENLRLLCPNCHSGTPTFGGRNKRRLRLPNHCLDCNVEIQRRSKRCQACYLTFQKTQISPRGKTQTPPVPHFCIDCGSKISRKASRCKSCAGLVAQKSKITWPPLEELLQMVQKSSYLAVGRQLGVSDNAVRKHLKKRGVNFPK